MFRKFGLFVLVFTSFFAMAATGLAAPGDLDPTFGDGGVVNTQLVIPYLSTGIYARRVIVQPDGKLLAVGNVGSGWIILVRYNADGSLDSYFGNNGKVLSIFNVSVNAVNATIQPDGRILVVGGAYMSGHYAYFVARYEDEGNLDRSFGSDGIALSDTGGNEGFNVWDVMFQPDGKIVILGQVMYTETFNLARLNASGSLDTSFGDGGRVSVNIGDGYPKGAALQRDGKIDVVGSVNTHSYVARVDRNGALDPTFGTNGVVNTFAGAYVDGYTGVAVDENGRIVALGLAADEEEGICYETAARYLPSGSLDESFGGNGLVRNNLSICVSYGSVAIQTNGKIVATSAGNLTSLIRYNSDGSLDNAFGDGGQVTIDLGYSSFLGAIALQPDGRILAAGGLQTVRFEDERILVLRFLGDALASNVKPSDFDGDGRSDISVFRPPDAAWYLDRSTDGLYAAQFGLPSDTITPADFDGDGKTDVAVYRPSSGTWYWLNSSDGAVHGLQFGASEDLPTPADYDGDSRADVSVFRPSNGTWYRQNSSDGSFFGRQFGHSEDKPVVGDYDGDGKADIAVFRPFPGIWYWVNSSNGSIGGEQFGTGDNIVVPGDYDGDGKTDLAVFSPTNRFWYIHNSSGGFRQFRFGLSDDTPAPGDFDGDGHTDMSVFRRSDGNWYRIDSSNGSFSAYHFGAFGDTPTENAFVY
jgi:uncharacterized delta-60 repeat protein